ncbi:hypothetical protein O9992_12090 [Vibrio lentus]|nr:hypothetical protein [Vibrio lentus]
MSTWSEKSSIEKIALRFGDVFKPGFSYHRSKVPAHHAELADKIAKADGYVMVSPECQSFRWAPALAKCYRYFGGSLFHISRRCGA